MQFVEDAGPLAHPVRPNVYREINNFYTATVYEKGAEVVRMLQTLLGVKNFRKGMDLYFERHDGEAATVEQFVQCFADASGVDLSQFMLWYSQAGTPEVVVSGSHDARSQDLPDGDRADGAADAGPAHQGADADSARRRPGRARRHATCRSSSPAATASSAASCLCASRPKPLFSKTLPSRRCMSLNRNFSAPVRVVANLSGDDLRFLAAHDSDPFNRWQAMQSLATRLLVDNVAAIRSGGATRRDEGLLDALAAILDDRIARTRIRGARAHAAGRRRHRPRDRARRRSRRDLHRPLRAARADRAAVSPARSQDRYRSLADTGPYRPDSAGAGRRALRNTCLELMVAARTPGAIALAAQQYRDADNMTDRVAALTALSRWDVPERAAALDDFYERYKDNALVVDKWLSMQASIPEPTTLGARQGAHRASGILDGQSQSRARAVRRVRDGEPDAAQSCRTAPATICWSTPCSRSIRKIRRSPPAC